jgi:hypothetical protein
MPIDIFNPDVQPSRTGGFKDDIVGRFRSGYQINGRPASLTAWRVTTDDQDVAEFISEALDGDQPQAWETKGDDDIEVFTKADSVDIIIEGESAIEARMLIWARGQKRIVTCDGTVAETEGKPHECLIGGFTKRAEHEEAGHVCEPVIAITFRLAENPDLGLFKFQSGAWSLATSIAKAIGDYAKTGHSAKGTLALEVVEYESGGTARKFTKPVLTITGPHEA